MFEKLLCFLIPSYSRMVKRVAVLERENRSLVAHTLDALVSAEKCAGMAMRNAALSQTAMRWPKSRKMMFVRLGNLASALKRRREKYRSKVKALCHKYNKPVPEFRDDRSDY